MSGNYVEQLKAVRIVDAGTRGTNQSSTKVGLAECLKWYSACLARMRPWVQAPVSVKK
jgi:hypothetical protein